MYRFGQAIGFGIMTNIFNNMFRGFGMFNSGYMYNPFYCCHHSPMFFMPNFSFGVFTQYPSSSPIPMPSFQNYTPEYTVPNQSIWGSQSQTPNFRLDQFLDPNYQNFNFDTFVYQNGNLGAGVGVNTGVNPGGNPWANPVGNYDTSRVKDKADEAPINNNKPIEEKPKEEIAIQSDRKIRKKYSADAKEMAAKWNKKLPKATNITEEFCQKVIDISKEVKCNPEDLMAMMNLESAHTFRPDIQNKGREKYYGLIQFGESAAIDVGKTLKELTSMTAIEQLDYVEIFLLKQKKYRGISDKELDAKTLYCLVLYPTLTNKKDDAIFAEKNGKGNSAIRYQKNNGLDRNNDGKITRGELDSALDAYRV